MPTRAAALAVMGLFCTVAACRAAAAELATFDITEPVGQDWTDEWLTQAVRLDTGGRTLRAGQLALVAEADLAGGMNAPGPAGSAQPLPAQFYRPGPTPTETAPLGADDPVGPRAELVVLFKATIRKGRTVRFAVTDDASTPPPWPAVTVATSDGQTTVANGVLELEFDASRPAPINAVRPSGTGGTLGTFHWPDGIAPDGVKNEWLQQGPARSVLRRTFQFSSPDLRYEITFDVRSGDPWIDVSDCYALGRGSAITFDLTALRADVVFHPHTYNARTFKADGKAEDTTLEPPQHPIATLGPIWRDIWFGGGPFAFIYNSKSEAGIGLAAVRGSQWDAPPHVTLESQNLLVRGHPKEEGRVRVVIPTDAGRRRWAIVVGHPDLRKSMGRLVRSHADIPLEKVLKQWVLDWKSDAPEVRAGAAGSYLGGYYNQHFFNPTTFPRTVRRQVPEAGPVRSRDLAVLAYVFSDPDYWPGPQYRWTIGNPNFHTDMYTIPLLIGLVMPDHPHARQWVERGIEETRGNLERDSFPGGAWKESLGYSSFFFRVVDNARRIQGAGAAQPFKHWPRFREVARYLAAMHTPTDPRYGVRQIAPIGDTHPGNYVRELNQMSDVFSGIDDALARQLGRFPAAGPDALDISSREFYGFGAMLRGNPYDDRNESFVTIKAGPARNHYQGDELAFHFCSLGTPLAIDHACHYSPRPWSASIHNRPDMNGKRPVTVAIRRALGRSDPADVFVADERTTVVSEVPMEPHLATRPGWEYPTVTLPPERPWTMRRYVMLVKHDPSRSAMADYLVVRDEIESPEPVGWNLHVLGRDIRRQRSALLFEGQLDVDLAAHVLSPEVKDYEDRQWGWRGKDSAALRATKGKEYEDRFFGAWIPKDFVRGTWGRDDATTGEMTKWLRLLGPAGRSDWLVLIVPNLQGRPAPVVEKLSDTAARVHLGAETEVVHLGTDGRYQAAIEREGRTTVLLEAGTVKPLAEVEFHPLGTDLDQGAR